MRPRTALLALSLVLPGLTGCSSSDVQTAPASTTTSATSATDPSSTHSSDAPQDPAPGAVSSVATQGPDPANPKPLPALTPAGSDVKLGQPVVIKIPVSGAGDSPGWAYVRVVVSSIKRADRAAQASMEKDLPKTAGKRLYLVNASFTVLALSGAARYGTVSPNLGGLDETGHTASTVYGGEDGGCAEGDLLDSSANLGDTRSGCFRAVPEVGTSVVGGYVTNDDTYPDDPYVKNPIVWKG